MEHPALTVEATELCDLFYSIYLHVRLFRSVIRKDRLQKGKEFRLLKITFLKINMNFNYVLITQPILTVTYPCSVLLVFLLDDTISFWC
jgi:hypothetical protein